MTGACGALFSDEFLCLLRKRDICKHYLYAPLQNKYLRASKKPFNNVYMQSVGQFPHQAWLSSIVSSR